MKKRNLLLLVCIMLIAALTLVSCGNKGGDETPHVHTPDSTKFVSDATHHWYGASCEHSDVKFNVAEHIDVNKDGVCDTCNYVTCTHTYDESAWTSDENNHWHAGTCGCNVTKDVTAHSDSNKDGKCDYCEYVTCTHTFADEYSSDENGHWLEYTCECELTPEVAAHEDNNKDGKCDVCAYITCEHNPETAWSSDVFTHWHATDCGCLVKIDEAAHNDADANGACDVCDYVCEHPEKTEWSADATGHWHDVQCNHEVTPTVEEHYDNNKDGKCDVCSYEDPNHTHTWELGFNKNQHYYYSTCEHAIFKDFADHVDANSDEKCDTCSAYIGDISEIVDSATSPEAANKINGGVIYDSLPDEEGFASIYTEYKFFKDYTYYTLWGENNYISIFDNNGTPVLIRVTDDGYSVLRDFYATDTSIINGPNIGIMYNYVSGIGVEGFIYALYTYATDGNELIYNYVEDYDSETGTYKFSFVRYEISEWSGNCVQIYSVSFKLQDGAIVNATVLAEEYYEGNYNLDAENNAFTLYENAELSQSYVYVIEQTVGARLGAGDEGYAANPYSGESIILKELEFTVNTKSYDEDYNEVFTPIDGVVLEDGCTITIAPGYENAIYLLLPEALASYGDLNVFNVETFADTGMSYPVMLYSYSEGTYPVTIYNELDSISFTLVVKLDPPTSLTGAQIVDYEKVEVSEITLYQGVSATIGAIAANEKQSPLVNASVTAGDPDVVTLIEDGSNWIVSASEIGTYTITLTSKLDESVSTTITLVVTAPPAIEDILVGDYEFTDWEQIQLSFTPDSVGALTGTVEIYFNDNSWFDAVVINETATYSYADGVITLTHVSGDGVDSISLVITESFGLGFVLVNDYGFEMTFELKKVTENDDPIVVEPNGTIEAPYIITDSTELFINVAMNETICYTFVPTSNGKLTFTVNNEFTDFSVGYGTYNFMLLDMMFAPTLTIDVIANTPVYFKVGTWSGDPAEYSITLTYEGSTPAGPTLESLAGTWTGVENTTIVGEVPYTLNIKADGTGTGVYNDGFDREFNITAVIINGNTVFISTDTQGNKILVFTYENGTLTTTEAFMLNALTLTNSAGGEEPAGPFSNIAGTWTGVEQSIIALNYTVVINADGTGTVSYEFGYAPTEFVLNGITLEDGVYTFDLTDARGMNEFWSFTYTDGKLYCSAADYGSALVLERSEGGSAVESITAADLAGEWTGIGSAYGTSVSYVINLEANGMGMGSYTVPHYLTGEPVVTNFEVVALEIAGNKVTLVYFLLGEYADGVAQTIDFTYADGTLHTLMGIMYEETTLTKTVAATEVTWSNDAFNPTPITESGTYVVNVAAGEKGYFSLACDLLGTDAIKVDISIDSGILYSVHPMRGDTPLPVTSTTEIVDAFVFNLLLAVGSADDSAATITVTITIENFVAE